MNAEAAQIRPSALPKLQECRCFQSVAASSDAAARGTRIDGIIRATYGSADLFGLSDLTEQDRAAVNYAIERLKFFAAGHEVLTNEAELMAVVPVDGVKAGTMDALCVGGAWLADFKTGQIYDYSAQMAAYALACMDAYFSDVWTSHIIYVDQQQVHSRIWTRAEAEALVLSIVNAPAVPTLCEYCKWCGAFETCPAVRGAVEETTEINAPACTPAMKSQKVLPPLMDTMLADHASAHKFLQKLKIANDWADILKTRLKDSLQALPADEKSPYFSLVVSSGTKKVNPLALAPYGMEFGFDRLLQMCAQIPLDKVLEQWQIVFKDKPFPEELVQLSGGSVSIRLKKAPKK